MKKSRKKGTEKCLKAVIFLGKILALIVLLLFTYGLFFCKNMSQLAVGVFITIFITMPTIFFFFFEEKSCKKFPIIIKHCDTIRTVCVTTIIFFILIIMVRFMGSLFV
jgi:hypothetical protein